MVSKILFLESFQSKSIEYKRKCAANKFFDFLEFDKKNFVDYVLIYFFNNLWNSRKF